MRNPVLLFVLSLLPFAYPAVAQVAIIPRPAEVRQPAAAGQLVITAQTPLVLEGSGLENSASFLNDYLEQVYGFRLAVSKKHVRGGIHLNYERMDHPIAGAYTLQVNKDQLYIAGDNATGVFYGVQSLLQLLPLEKSASLKVPFVTIKDYPRFQYRGLHLDVGRHFFPVAFVKRYIDYIALHKMNVFHWHLTEDQGWRIEIKKYPKLTEVGGYRNGTIIGRYPGKGNDGLRYGGFYTQAEVKEIVAYAAQRYVEVIPEIEMPGHASAALTAYPTLGCTGGPYKVQETWGVFNDVFCAGNDTVFNFLQDVLDEVMPLFASKYVHIGGDECPKESWKHCAKCQQRMKAHGLKDEHELQSYFIQRMEKYINGKGKTIIGWDEILEGGLAPNAVVMSWRGEQGGIEAAQQNHDVIMTPGSHVYLDHSQTKNEDSVTIGGYTAVQKTYSYEPVPAALTAAQAKHVLGAQGNVWTEYMKNTSKVEYMIFPRLSALSEVLWSPKELRNWPDFEKRLITQFKRYGLWRVNYSRAFFQPTAAIVPTENRRGVYWQVTDPMAGAADPMAGAADHGGLWTVQHMERDSSILTIPDMRNDPDGSKGMMLDSIVIYDSGTVVHGAVQKILVTRTSTLTAAPRHNQDARAGIEQRIEVNKATGQPISIATATAANRPGNGGAFGLVNGAKAGKAGIGSEEWLGWQGPDMEAVIELGLHQFITRVGVNFLEQRESWVYLPQYVEVFISEDGKTWQSRGKSSEFVKGAYNTGHVTIHTGYHPARYVKVVARNYGTIPAGQPGAGSKAWLFVDEIGVK